MTKNRKDLEKLLDELMRVAVDFKRDEIISFLITNFKEYFKKENLQLYLEKSAANGYISTCKIFIKYGTVITDTAILLAKKNNHRGTATYLRKRRAFLRSKAIM